MITCITVSVNYDDLLDIILPQNYKFFKTWYIITHEKDQKTIDVINKHGFDNVKILFFDFYNGAIFNKGGAVKYAQNLVDDGEKILLLDSDVFIPDEFSKYVDFDVKKDVLYSCKRKDYHSYSDFIKNIPDPGEFCSDFMGYFQLYRQDKKTMKYVYEDAPCCKHSDYKFCFDFDTRILLDGITVKHLGRAGINHEGRRDKNDFAKILTN